MKIGVDLVYIDRFINLKENLSFMKKIFNYDELKYIESKNNSTATICGLYASKEAFLKSIKMGINNFPLKDIEIYHDDNNAPFIKLHNTLYEKYKNKKFDISISHDKDYAIATVIAY